MNKKIIVNRVSGEERLALLEDKKLVSFSIIRDSTLRYLGNIYCGVVKRVITGMQSAFVEFGGERTGFIHIKDLKKDISYEEFQKNIDTDDEDSEPDSSNNKNEKTISEYIKPNQTIIVQVIKEPIGSKGARLTAHVTIPGRFAVLMPTILHIGISKKIKSKEKRDYLHKIGEKVVKKGYGIILRTMAAETEPEILEKEIVSLINKWNSIQNSYAKHGREKSLLMEADTPLIENIKNSYSSDLEEIVVDHRDDYLTVKNYLESFIPERKEILKFYELPYPIFDYYNIEPEIQTTLKKKVWMHSGGFLYIEQTEALTVIDVNTGKYLGKNSLEETILKTNIEAAEEISHQVRLRNIAGIIVVDFIDMRFHKSKDKVLLELDKQLAKDPAKTKVYKFTRLGLIQITRKRTAESNTVLLTTPCPYCAASGHIKSQETVSFEIIREMIRNAILYGTKNILVEAHPEIIFHLEHKLERELKQTTSKHKIIFTLKSDKSFHKEHFLVSENKGV